MDDPFLAEQDRHMGFSWRIITSRRLLYFSQLFNVAGSATARP
jgi:hypothetical protein